MVNKIVVQFGDVGWDSPYNITRPEPNSTVKDAMVNLLTNFEVGWMECGLGKK